METIFNYNPTKKELESFLDISQEEYNELLDEDCKNRDLAALFHMRGQKRKMMKYINKVKDVDMRNSFFRTIYHP